MRYQKQISSLSTSILVLRKTISRKEPNRLAAKLHHGHPTGSRDIQNGWILSGQASYLLHRHHSNILFTTANH
jgi:hypothetical protein